MRIITTAVIKGGTGKTTTAAALAQTAKANNKKVLAVDLDPQANLTFTLGADQNAPGSYELLHGTPAAQLVQETPQGIFVISASPDLATEATAPASGKRLANALKPISDDYDICFIDTPPTLGELQYNALQAADGLIIPLLADTYSLQGLYQITDIANQMQKSNPALSILGIVINRFNARSNIAKFMQETMIEKGAEIGAPYLMAIRNGIAISEAQAMQQSLFDYAPKSKPAQDYMQLYKMIEK